MRAAIIHRGEAKFRRVENRERVSRQLKILRESGFATVRAEDTRRVYAVDVSPLAEVDAWLNQFRHLWGPRLEALATRGKRKRRNRR